MKKLIDKEETIKRMCESCGYCDRQECDVDRCNIYKFLSEHPIVVCVSDDFQICNKGGKRQ